MGTGPSVMFLKCHNGSCPQRDIDGTVLFFIIAPYLFDALVWEFDAQLISQAFIRPHLKHILQVSFLLYFAPRRTSSLHLLAYLPLLTTFSWFYFLMMLRAISGQHQSRQILMLARSTALFDFNPMLIPSNLTLHNILQSNNRQD